MSVVFIHYEMEPATLRPWVPFALDVRDGSAYVSVVAFAQQRLRFCFGGAWTAWVGALGGNHGFLNVRTYVRAAGESGIYFLAEWVPSPVTSWVAPRLYGLPCRLGRLDYGGSAGQVRAGRGRWKFRVEEASGPFRVCEPGSLDEFLLERYVAFTQWRGCKRMFRVEHEPWPQKRVEVVVEEDSLLAAQWPWWREAKPVGANFSPGVRRVWIGPPRRLP
jgi:uncharacterized protein YqjF (DUF2071 family)